MVRWNGYAIGANSICVSFQIIISELFGSAEGMLSAFPNICWTVLKSKFQLCISVTRYQCLKIIDLLVFQSSQLAKTSCKMRPRAVPLSRASIGSVAFPKRVCATSFGVIKEGDMLIIVSVIVSQVKFV